MKGAQKTISVIELRRLLQELKDNGSGVCVRFRLLGEMWYPNFTRIVLVTERKALLFDENANKTLLINELENVIQFELDNRFQHFQPHFHYEVKPMPEFKAK